jgi:hypothetical protein
VAVLAAHMAVLTPCLRPWHALSLKYEETHSPAICNPKMASLNTVSGYYLNSPLPSTGRDATQEGIEKTSTPASLTTSDLLDSINSKIPPPDTVLEELRILRAIHKQLRSESTKVQFVWDALLQIMGIVSVGYHVPSPLVLAVPNGD